MPKIARTILKWVFALGLIITAILGLLETIVPHVRRVLELLGL